MDYVLVLKYRSNEHPYNTELNDSFATDEEAKQWARDVEANTFGYDITLFEINKPRHVPFHLD